MLAVATDPYVKSGQAYLASVAPVTLDIWDIRSIAPNPQIPCFGAFSERDTFIALTWSYRDQIEDFADEARKYREIWDRLLGPCAPFRGDSLDDYLSGNYFAV
jgi:hypothetical protein